MHPTIFIYNFIPLLEYVLVTPDEEKRMWGLISHQMILITEQTRNAFMTKPSKSLHHKQQHNIQSYTDILNKDC